MFTTETAYAHESITIGNYELEIGWVDEPPIAGQQNAIVVTISDMSSGGAMPVEDLSSLEATISYGGQSKVLAFQPRLSGEGLFVMDLDGSNLTQLIVDPEVHGTVSWIP